VQVDNKLILMSDS